MALGEVLVKSKFFKDASEHAQAVVKVLAGRELGLGPIASMTGFHIVEGKPSMSANLYASFVRRHPHYDYRVRENTPERCVVEFLYYRFGKSQPGEPESLGKETWDAARVKAAGLGTKKNWLAYPQAMLFARTISSGVRTYCPDVFHGATYVEGELDATEPEARPVAAEVRPVVGEVSPTGTFTGHYAAPTPTAEPVKVEVIPADPAPLVARIAAALPKLARTTVEGNARAQCYKVGIQPDGTPRAGVALDVDKLERCARWIETLVLDVEKAKREAQA